MFRERTYKQEYISSNIHNRELRQKLKRKEKENRELIEYTRKLRNKRNDYCYLC